jgi:putative transposase
MSDRPQTIQFWRGALPHWEVVDGRYFVTMRVAGCLPASALLRLRDMTDRVPSNGSGGGYLEWSRRYFQLQEQLLHEAGISRGRPDPGLSQPGGTPGSGEPLLPERSSLWLRRDDIAESVLSTAKRYDESEKWRLSACIVMPNHIHISFMAGTSGLTKAMKDFKHCTARNANALLGRKGKRFWQKEWFDHWSRSAQEDDRIRSYIQNNAVRAGLVKDGQQWPWLWLRDQQG